MWYWAISIALLLLLGYALIEPYRIKVTEYQVAIAGLGQALEGLTILQLSDLHGRVGVFYWPPFLRRLAVSDVVVITGDLYSPTLPRTRLARYLDQLHAALGVYYISGNHDYRGGELRVNPWEPGERRLDNRVVRLERDGQYLLLAGLPDFVMGQPRWDLVRSALEQSNAPAVLLAHRPDAWFLPGVERVGLILAGHTHGGQVRFPWVGALLRHNRLPGRYVAGRLDVAGHPVLITSQGLGTSELPVRFLTRPEVIVVRLTAKKEEDETHGDSGHHRRDRGL